MSFYENLFLDIIIILFPIFIYLLYVAYSNNVSKEKNNLIFDFVNLTLLYIVIKYKVYFDDIIFLLLLNIPIILSYLKKRTKFSILLSLIIIVYTYLIYKYSIIYLLIEYLIYFVIYYLFYYKNKNYDRFLYLFLFIKGVIISFEAFYVLPLLPNEYIIVVRIFLILIIFYAITCLVVNLLNKGEEILSLNVLLKELEHAKTIGNCLFRITHEIKNPLAVCKGYLDMMDYSKLDKVKKYNDIIKEEINRSLIILDDFKDFTKIKVNLDVMDINMLVEETSYSVKTLLIDKKINLKINLCEDDLYINGDYNRLKQVLINAIKNSAEAINNEKGLIEITTKKDKNNVLIIIKDNGIGMDKETLQKCGELFYTTKQHGTGLGVGLSKEIIKLHNGKMTYKSKVNSGTELTICLQKIK